MEGEGKGRIKVTTTIDDTMVLLEFGDETDAARYGSVEVPPEVAMAFVSSQRLRDQIRTKATKAHLARQRIERDEANKG